MIRKRGENRPWGGGHVSRIRKGSPAKRGREKKRTIGKLSAKKAD